MAGLDGVSPALAAAFLRIQADARAAGFSIGISSGYRDAASQAALRRAHCCNDPNSSRCSCGPPTAPPGTSQHQRGAAIDISGTKAAKAWVNANAGRYGVHFPVAGEDWHMELIDGGGHAHGAQQMAGMLGFDINTDTGPSQEERQDMMIQGYMDAITGAQRDELLATPGTTIDPETGESVQTAALATPGATELESPAASETAQPGSPENAAKIRMDTVALGGGQPGAPMAGGGAWTGNVPPPGYIPPGEGVGRWRDVAIAALRYTGQDPGMVDTLLRRMAQESGGDPSAVNNWDINAKRGDPSKGLMQNIGSAFPDRARELAGRGIFDGFANIVASIRYTLNRYGNLARGWNRPGGY